MIEIINFCLPYCLVNNLVGQSIHQDNTGYMAIFVAFGLAGAMIEKVNRALDGRTDKRTDGLPDRRTDGRTDGWTDRWTDGQTDGRTD